jgi:hypothetical protein
VKNWSRVEGKRNHLADFPEKGFNGFFCKNLAKFCKWAIGGLK